MRQIDEEKYKKLLDKARVKFGMTFYGHSDRLSCVVKWDEKTVSPDRLTDEQLMLVAQLTGKAREPLIDELRRRKLIPERKEGETPRLEAGTTEEGEHPARSRDNGRKGTTDERGKAQEAGTTDESDKTERR